MKKQNGFTLIELVVVIVILGILAVVAVPKYMNLSDEASKAAMQGVAGALKSSVSLIQAKAKVTGAKAGDNVTIGKGEDGKPVTVVVNGEGYPVFTPSGDDATAYNALSTIMDVPEGYNVAIAKDTTSRAAAIDVTVTVEKTRGSQECAAVYTSSTGAVTTGCKSVSGAA